MADLDHALTEIRSIRRQIAQTTEFRGYGPATLFATAACAAFTGAIQSLWLPSPASSPVHYVALWLATGIVCAALILTQALTRANRLHSGMADEMIRVAVAQFLPAAIAGLILPFVLLRAAPSVFWMLPGLWQIVFSLGVFASCRCLPRFMVLVGVWFLLTGMVCLDRGEIFSLHPAAMACPFAIGMALVGVIHHLSHAKVTHDETP